MFQGAEYKKAARVFVGLHASKMPSTSRLGVRASHSIAAVPDKQKSRLAASCGSWKRAVVLETTITYWP